MAPVVDYIRHLISDSKRWFPTIHVGDFTAGLVPSEAEGLQPGSLILQAQDAANETAVSRLWQVASPLGQRCEQMDAQEIIAQQAINVRSLGADPTGRTPSGHIINDAIQEAKLKRYGRIYIPAGNYLIEEPIVLDSLLWLHGDGMSTYLRAANGLDLPMIQAYYSIGTRWSYMQRISDMRLDGNRDNQTSTNARGIRWTSPDSITIPILVDEEVGHPYVVSENYSGQWFDSNRDAFNLWISYCYGDGFYQEGRGGGHFHNITSYENGGYGFVPTYDTAWVNCTAGRNGQSGWRIRQSAVKLSNCKSWWSGYRTDSDLQYQTSGFEFSGTTRGSVAVGCEAQDNYGSGFTFNSAIGHVCYGCVSDSNNRRNGDNVGVDFYASYGNVWEGFCYDRYNDSQRYQDHALRFRSSSSHNRIIINHRYYGGGASSYAQFIQHISADTDSLQGNQIEINNQNGFQKSSSGTPTISVFHGGTVLINLNANTTIAYDGVGTIIPPGAKLKFQFVQDGTGGRTVAFSSSFRYSWSPDTTASKINTIEFTWNDEISKWVQSATTTGM